MQFESIYQQGPAQIARLRELETKPDLTIKQLVVLCTESAVQGFDSFPQHIAKLDGSKRADVQRFVKSNWATWRAVRAIPGFVDVLNDPDLFQKLYALDTPYFELGTKRPRTLLIVFTTMHNNFHISNLALLAMLRALGVSILILKDSSRFNYLRGWRGFGADFEASCTTMRRFIADRGFDKVHISGFSASSFASLLMAARIGCDGYLGFSIRTEILDRPDFKAGEFFTQEIREMVPRSLHLDLGPVLRDRVPPIACRVILGNDDRTDVEQARNIANVPGVTIRTLLQCDHRTVERLLITDGLLPEFELLVGRDEDHIG